MTESIRVGVVGLGKVAQIHHLPALDELDGMRIAAVCDLSAELARATATRYGLSVNAAFTDVEQFLDQDIDAVVIATNHHGPVLCGSIRAGLPTFVEKPCTWGLAEAKELTALSAELAVPVVVGYMKRYDPAFERFRDILQTAPFYVRVHNFAGGRHRHERIHPVRKPGADVDASVLAAEERTVDQLIAHGLGDDHPARIQAFRTLAQLAIHDVNLILSLFGSPRDGRLTRFATPVGPGYLISLEFGALRCELEILADFSTARDWDESVHCYSPEGMTELVFQSPFLRHAPTVLRRRFADGIEIHAEAVVTSRQSPYVRELAHFREVARGLAQPRTTLPGALADLELLYDLVRKMDIG